MAVSNPQEINDLGLNTYYTIAVETGTQATETLFYQRCIACLSRDSLNTDSEMQEAQELVRISPEFLDHRYTPFTRFAAAAILTNVKRLPESEEAVLLQLAETIKSTRESNADLIKFSELFLCEHGDRDHVDAILQNARNGSIDDFVFYAWKGMRALPADEIFELVREIWKKSQTTKIDIPTLLDFYLRAAQLLIERLKELHKEDGNTEAGEVTATRYRTAIRKIDEAMEPIPCSHKNRALLMDAFASLCVEMKNSDFAILSLERAIKIARKIPDGDTSLPIIRLLRERLDSVRMNDDAGNV